MLRLPSILKTKPLVGILSAVLLTLSLYGTLVWADNLEQLRTSGAIGESYSGYVVARNSSAQAEANAINTKRRAIYQEKAATQGVSVDQVGKVYAMEIFKKIPAGTWFQKENGQWVQK
ncbi:YdbL family protein [Nitrosomonas sp. Is37]|uniref:YdbL family protein n=1 Tax=Nitrosomonas sp. Is37 TaxID=3080535 RepID=UPI00294B624A|nr:YdbL family protein [Nitrosomonas sp. Is37]MDV6345629.1 YdbL family protein [Nitrosomonas sp. Is37]